MSDPFSAARQRESSHGPVLTAGEVSLQEVAKAIIEEQQVFLFYSILSCDYCHDLLRALSPSYETICITNSYPVTCIASPPYAGKWPPTSA